VSAIAASSAGAVDIVTTLRSISTTVQLEDEQMLVLGGLIDEAFTDSEQKVPFLGDIPGIGALFRSNRSQKVKRNLMVFIRATIIKDPAKARTLSINKYNFMRDIQLQENEGDDILGPVLVPYE
jgi:general secretion pathway protein D